MDTLARSLVIGVVGLAVLVFCLWLLWKPPGEGAGTSSDNSAVGNLFVEYC